METEQWISKTVQSVTMDLGPTDEYRDQRDLLDNCDENDNSMSEAKFGTDTELNKRLLKAEAAISEISRKNIEDILEQVKTLNPIECMLLYLKLPTEYSSVADPLRQPLNPLGSRSEISQTIMWIKTHLEEDPELSLPKQDVYNEYYAFCGPNKIKPLSTADFGKVMKQVYPRVRPRRLGTRGNSRYCYAGLRRRLKLDIPFLPDLSDKPQSSEITCTSTDLLAATWTVVKEWSEQQLEMQFPSVQALACYLVLNLSIGTGTEAATLITSAVKNSFHKADLLQSVTSCSSKHREAQLQLQRKIQQKNEINKEQKRKMQLQTTKTELKPRNKRCKLQNQSSVISSTNVSPTNVSFGDLQNPNSPPVGIQSVCDKSIDFSSLSTLPDFSSFHKTTANDEHCDYTKETNRHNSEENSPEYVLKSTCHAKVPIPRLNPNLNKFSLTSPKRGKHTKYKEIQPKPEPCDSDAFNDQLCDASNLRSHEASDINENYRKRLLLETFKSDIMDVNIPLSRERLISISEIDKSALDDYLGASNSQEQEEELAKYFENRDKTPDQEYAAKLAQLRNLLINQQNVCLEGGTQNGNLDSRAENTLNLTSLLSSNLSAIAKGNFKNFITGIFGPNTSQHYQKENDQLGLSLTARRRVTFDNIQPEAVPPSPDTRRKNFNFTPISPGPSSPGEKYSKCSSASASPFVSPRSTPISRGKTSVNSNVSSSHLNSGVELFNLMQPRKQPIPTKPLLKIKQETDTHNDVDMSSDLSIYLPMSAPPSPKHFKTRNTNLLHKLLNSNNKVAYSPSYLQSHNNSLNDPLSSEISQFFSSDIQQMNMEPTYRSQSVPLHQMSFKSSLSSPSIQNSSNVFPFQNSSSIGQAPIDEEMNEFGQFSTNENILPNIEDSNSDVGCDDMNLQSNNFDLSINRQHYNNDSFDEHSVSTSSLSHLSNLRILSRSQSIDIDGGNDINASLRFPSRSVPGTPIPNYDSKHYRSYPTTPILTNPSFSYSHGHDYLLNGQPIKEVVSSNTLKPNLPFLQNSESNEGFYGNEIYNINDSTINSEIPFGDKNHFNFDGNLTDTNLNLKRHATNINTEINGNDYCHKSSNIDSS